jgi:hypothetical protein
MSDISGWTLSQSAVIVVDFSEREVVAEAVDARPIKP